MRGIWIGVVAVGLVLGCAQEKPVPLRDESLGIAAVFPGAPTANRYSEPTPFGTLDWFCRAYRPPVRMDQNFQVDVGNLPAGSRGGTTAAQVLDTYHGWLIRRFGKVEKGGLAPGKGPGFAYRATVPNGAHLEGIVVVRRGRLHRAEATSSKAADPKVRAFLDSFEVLP